MTLRVRRLDSNGDMMFGGYGSSDFYVDKPETVAQIIGTRLWLWRGEWFLNLFAGMTWLTQVVGTGTLRLANTVIRNYIAQSPGVRSIIAFSSNYDSNARKLSVDVTVDTIFGVVRLVQESGTQPQIFILGETILGSDVVLG